MAAVMAASAEACSVPVFRYALERWPADPYTVVVFHRGALTPEERDAVAALEDESKAGGSHGNLEVREVDILQPMTAPLIELLKTVDQGRLPALAILYPGVFRMKRPVWTGPLTPETVQRIVKSPARDEIARRILDGESAVWVLLESGDRARDDAAAKTLESSIGEALRLLELPVLDANSPGFVPIDESGPPLRLAYSMVRVARDDPSEAFFIHMLMGTEPDLGDYAGYPMAFPVYGRGRALYALVGDGIDKANIVEACTFVIGPCSCQVKELNPGIDIIMNVDWDSRFKGLVLPSSELPPLVGLSELVSDASGKEDSTERSEGANPALSAEHPDSTPSEGAIAAVDTVIAAHSQSNQPQLAETGHGGGILRNFLIVIALVLTATVASTMTIVKPWKRSAS
jgi:hypothetical protein